MPTVWCITLTRRILLLSLPPSRWIPACFPACCGRAQPGSIELAQKTAELMKDFRAVVWEGHGVVACSETFDDTFGLIDTLEKAANIYAITRAMRGGDEAANLLSDDQLRVICEGYGLEPNEDFLS